VTREEETTSDPVRSLLVRIRCLLIIYHLQNINAQVHCSFDILSTWFSDTASVMRPVWLVLALLTLISSTECQTESEDNCAGSGATVRQLVSVQHSTTAAGGDTSLLGAAEAQSHTIGIRLETGMTSGMRVCVVCRSCMI
jgi:hypothetical protein